MPFLDIHQERERVFVIAQSDLDLATVEEVRAEVTRLRRAGFTALVLDLRELTFIDSEGLDFALEQHKLGDVTVLAEGRSVVRAFELAGLADLLHVDSAASAR